MAGTPAFWARTLRSQAIPALTLPVDLDAIIDFCPLTLVELPLDGFLGLCLRFDNKCGIMIKEGQGSGRRRFTIAHELGHFAIPSHDKRNDTGHRCFEDAIFSRADTDLTEREANAFAAELLMPRSEFVADMGTRGPSVRTLKELSAANRYDVSLTACAIRWVELSLDPLALLCYEHGRLKWQVRSKNFRYYLPARGSGPPDGSAVREACTTGTSYDDPVSVADVGWLADSSGCEDLLESAIAIPAHDQAICLLEVVRDR